MSDSPGTFSSPYLPSRTQMEAVIAGLRQYAPPSDKHAEYLRAEIHTAKSELPRYDAEITAVKAMLERLACEREWFRTYNEACESAFSPARRLPPEVLLHIFSFAAKVRYHSHAAVHEQYCLHAIARVCTQWRTLLLETSHLWRDIYADLTHTFDMNAAMAPLAQNLRWGRPSALAPISFNLKFNIDNEAGRFALGLLAQHAESWRSASITVRGTGFFGEELNCAKGKLGNLESLEILSHQDLHDLDVFTEAPKLTHVAFSNTPPLLPWHQIQAVTCKPLSEPNSLLPLLQFLDHCPPTCNVTLPNLSIAYLYRWREEAPAAPTVQSAIRSLRLGLSYYDLEEDESDLVTEVILADFFDYLDLPELRALSINADMNRETAWKQPIVFPDEAFLAFASRSSNISSLFLHDIRISPEQLIAALGQLPALERLFFQDLVLFGEWDEEGFEYNYPPHHVALTNEVLQHLTDASVVAPHLIDLRVAALFDDVSHPTLVGCIRSRTERAGCRNSIFGLQITTLQRAYYPTDYRKNELADLLQPLVDGGGLKLTFIPKYELKVSEFVSEL
ncbi:F-box domain-containing protein [Mycena kentingensis (nom. inval.)]|nr:F-box domain-containing protein [Mycena kentingensis (nom. inval.)]